MFKRSSKDKAPQMNAADIIRVSSKRSSFNDTEAYRQLRTNIEFSSFSKNIKVVNVTSANPHEGKSSVACNLALIATAKYSRVLLIDCDLRRPVQHRIFNISNQNGVSNLVKNLEALDNNGNDCFSKVKYGDFNGYLYVLPSGMSVPNPQELLSSSRFAGLIAKCREYFDFIVVDCPPMNTVVDAIPVSSVCDGTIFVVSAKETDKKASKAALESLNRSGANVLGAVLNKADMKEKRYYSYSSYDNYFDDEH